MTPAPLSPGSFGGEPRPNPWIPPELLALVVNQGPPNDRSTGLRKERRFLVDQPAQLVSVGKAGGVWPVRIRDVSPRGMQLRTEEAINTPPEVRVRWNGRDVPGIVRYNHKYDAGTYRLGIELDAPADDLIREILTRQSQELRDANLVLQQQAARAAQYATLLDLVSEAVFVLSPEGVVFFWNQAAERLYGWSRAEVLGQNFHQLIPSELALELDGSGTERRLRQIRKDGSPVDVVSRFVAQPGSDGQIEAVVSISRNNASASPGMRFPENVHNSFRHLRRHGGMSQARVENRSE